eukprot:scaffold335_cov142-Skeletonema_menzelii.AAC.17
MTLATDHPSSPISSTRNKWHPGTWHPGSWHPCRGGAIKAGARNSAVTRRDTGVTEVKGDTRHQIDNRHRHRTLEREGELKLGERERRESGSGLSFELFCML